MTDQEIQATVTAYFTAIQEMEEDSFLALFSEDAASFDPVGSPPYRGHDGLRKFLKGTAGLFERLQMSIDQIFVSGNGAAVKWAAHGVGRAGGEARFEGIDVFELDEAGKIVKLWAYWSPKAMMAQLKQS